MSTQLSERSQQLLNSLIARYIRDGQPVGSKALVAETGIKVSSATARNIMADLETQGLLQSPHTSAGRIPTVQGYRLFVDQLLTTLPPNAAEPEQWLTQLGLSTELIQAHNPQQLIAQASNLLSEVSHMAGIVTTPKRDSLSIKQIEFVPLSEQDGAQRVLVILVTDDEQIQNQVLQLEQPIDKSRLEQAANYLNQHFTGHNLNTIRQTIFQAMQNDRHDLDQLMQTTIDFAEQVAQQNVQEDMLVSGQTNLMQFAELNDVQRLRELFEAFNQKNELLLLLDNCIHSQGVQIFIGSESGMNVLDDCAMITAPYTSDGHTVGMLGVIGPTRMAYDRMIPIVDATARLLSAALSHKHDS